MGFSQHRLTLQGDTPGSQFELVYYAVGPEEDRPKVYLQAALHADEQPGTMVLHHLLPRLREADASGRLQARFVVLPMANPLGMANLSFRQHLGRYDGNTGVNYNRRWPDLFTMIGDEVASSLGQDGPANVKAVRRAIGTWIESQDPRTAAEALRLAVLRLCHDADYVLDLHCDSDSLIHIFTSPEFDLQDLADWMGAAATLVASDSGGGSFDEMLPVAFRKIQAANPDKPVPIGAQTATLEYRGTADSFDDLGSEDARRLFGFFAERGLIAAEVGPRPPAAPPATPFDATEVVRTSAPGLLAYRVELGARVSKGEAIADLIALDGPDAFLGRTPILAGQNGLVLSRSLRKYAPRGANIAKIVGTEPLTSRSGGYLLED